MTEYLKRIAPMIVLPPLVSLVDSDLNQAYLLSEMVTAVQSSCKVQGRDLMEDRWVLFEIEDFAENLRMPEAWIYAQAWQLNGKSFFRSDFTQGAKGVIEINVGKLMELTKEAR